MSGFSIVEFYKKYFLKPNKEWYDNYKQTIDDIKQIKNNLNSGKEILPEELDKIFKIYVSQNNGVVNIGSALSGMNTNTQQIRQLFDENEKLRNCILKIIKKGCKDLDEFNNFNNTIGKIFSENGIGVPKQINRRFAACCSLSLPTTVSDGNMNCIDSFFYQLLGKNNHIPGWYLQSIAILREIDNAFIKELGLSEDILDFNDTNSLEITNKYTEEVSNKLNIKFDLLLRNTIPYIFCKNSKKEENLKEKSRDNKMKNKQIISHNTILYGPPGTGKTFNTMCYALSILEPDPIWEAEIEKDYDNCKKKFNEYISAGRIAFTTFHQSYSYEDFIEGLKPSIDSYEQDGNEVKSVIYEVQDGIFKSLCKRACVSTENQNNFESIWEELLGKLQEQDYIEVPLLSNANKSFRIELNSLENGLTSRTYEDNKYEKGNWIRGQSKFFSKEQMYNIYRGKPGIPSGGHDNYRKAIIAYMIKEMGLHSYDESWINQNKDPYVIIIDEINRGNISKIFGELITLIEDTKRDGAKEKCEVILPYSKEPFSVPDNVYIIGTMNTADRSIAFIDTALRRRFNFVEMNPNEDLLDSITIKDTTIDLKKMLHCMNRRIEFLYDREHTLGHAFFLPLKNNPSIELLGNIFKQKIIPLLQEYFYEDYENIRLILGDDGKKEEYQFIKSESFDESTQIFRTKSISEFDLNMNRYTVNNNAFGHIESYIGIYENPEDSEKTE